MLIDDLWRKLHVTKESCRKVEQTNISSCCLWVHDSFAVGEFGDKSSTIVFGFTKTRQITIASELVHCVSSSSRKYGRSVMKKIFLLVRISPISRKTTRTVFAVLACPWLMIDPVAGMKIKPNIWAQQLTSPDEVPSGTGRVTCATNSKPTGKYPVIKRPKSAAVR